MEEREELADTSLKKSIFWGNGMHFTVHPIKQPLPLNEPFTSLEPTDLNQLQLNLHLGTADSLVAEVGQLWRLWRLKKSWF